MNPTKVMACALLFFCGAGVSFAADGPSAPSESVLIPQTVYVGDRARLVVSLGAGAASVVGGPTVSDVAERLPRSKDAVVLRVELQRFEGGWRALVDFIAYAPGIVELPRIEIAGTALTGLTATIASILDTESGTAELAPTAPALSAPGTTLLVYGAAFTLIVTALGLAFFLIHGPAMIRSALERRRRGLTARSMRRVTALLAKDMVSMDSSEFISILFSELRSYLTYRTGINYLALTPRELVGAASAAQEAQRPKSFCVGLDADDSALLEKLFRWGDEVRFGGALAPLSDLRSALENVVSLVEKIEAALDAAYRGPSSKSRPSGAIGTMEIGGATR